MKFTFATAFLAISVAALAVDGQNSVDTMVGGYEDIATNNADMLKALQSVKSSFEYKLEQHILFDLGPVHSAKRQAVNGLNYDVSFSLIKKNCLGQTVGGNGLNCLKQQLLCEVVIWAKQDNTYQLTSVSCK